MKHTRGLHSADEAKLNPSYDTTFSPEKRVADFLGKYFVGLNGATAPNERHKQEIIDYISQHILPAVRKRAWSLMASRINSHGFILLMDGEYELKEKQTTTIKDRTKLIIKTYDDKDHPFYRGNDLDISNFRK